MEITDWNQRRELNLNRRLKKLPDDIEEDDPNAHVEIEEIIGHRKRAKNYEYLVKWKNQNLYIHIGQQPVRHGQNVKHTPKR